MSTKTTDGTDPDLPSVYTEDQTVVYRASALGGCLHALAAARQGYEASPYPPVALEAFKAGQETEDWFFEEYSHLLPPISRQKLVQLRISRKIVIRGHVDALVHKVWEVKSQTPDDWEKWTPDWWTTDPLWRKYAWQLSVYMLATGRQGVMVRVRRPAESKQDVATQIIEKPFHSLQEVKGRVFEAETLARADVLRCKVGEFFCAYPEIHEQVEITDEPELEKELEYYLTMKARVDDNQAEMKKRREAIERLMAGRRKVALLSGHTVSRSEVEVKEYVVKASKQTRLTVKGPK